MMKPSTRIHIPLHAALAMLGKYARQRLAAQVRAVAFIVVYLAAFQMLILGSPPADAWRIGGGIGMVILGLTLFLEGLILGLMPLGERVGLKLPQRVGLAWIILFGLLLGFGATLAEPAIAGLQTMGGNIKAWEAPLLFHMIENAPWKLVISIGLGVGLAVALGMIRLYFGWSIKPFVYVLVPLLLCVSAVCALNANLVALIGLAWDAGAVTTGPVTVPMVLALGIGVSRSIHRQQTESSGFGMIMLASAIPVLAVLALGISMNPSMPRAMAETEFFAAENRSSTIALFPSDEALARHAFTHGSDAGRETLFGEAHPERVRSLADPAVSRAMLGRMTLTEWQRQQASARELNWLPPQPEPLLSDAAPGSISTDKNLVMRHLATAIRAVAPLTALLFAVLMLFLRDRLRHNDELALGMALSLLGMALLTGGIRIGLSPLGNDVGRSLPRVFRVAPIEEGRIWIEPFDPTHVIHVYESNGDRAPYFHLRDKTGGAPRLTRFVPDRFDPDIRRYDHVIERLPLLHPKLTFAGLGLVLLFAFGLGYGSTLAEPALAALGHKVEEITVGTVQRTGVVRAVSFGVGFGLVAGTVRLLFDVPTLWLLAPPYLLLLWLTWKSDDDFAGIAWDCGGVTTGPITVPLVMAMGLGIGGELQVVDGFGALAMASVYPIVTVMTYGLILRARQRRTIRAGEEEHRG